MEEEGRRYGTGMDEIQERCQEEHNVDDASKEECLS
jgi:hypothetical protein